MNVFLSAFTLEELGAADYSREIDAALESATVLLAIGTSADHLNSEWVRYEWDSFANDIRSRRKPHGRIFTYIEGMPITALPRGLRQTQTFVHGEASLERLYNFINKALPRPAEQREREGKERVLEAEQRQEERPEAERRQHKEKERLEHVLQSPPLDLVTSSTSPRKKKLCSIAGIMALLALVISLAVGSAIYLASPAEIFPESPVAHSRWPLIQTGHTLVPMHDGRILDWVASDGSWRLWN